MAAAAAVALDWGVVHHPKQEFKIIPSYIKHTSILIVHHPLDPLNEAAPPSPLHARV